MSNLLLSQVAIKRTQAVFYLRFGRADKKDIFKSFRMDLNSCATSRREACMESMQSIVWNPLQDGMESSRRKCTFGDAMRLRRYHTRLRVIPYQACGLDKKTTTFCQRLSFFGRGYRNRTYTKGVRGPCATTTPSPTDVDIIFLFQLKHKQTKAF